MYIPDFVKKDPWLQPHLQTITGRLRKAYEKEKELVLKAGSLSDFSNGHHYFGLHRRGDRWLIREWAPNAERIFLLGEFSSWRLDEAYCFHALGDGTWELSVDAGLLPHESLYKLYICWPGGSGDRIPAWATRVVQDPVTHVFNAQVWDPPGAYQWKNKGPVHAGKTAAKRNDAFSPVIYEAHAGMATEEYKVGSWDEFRRLRLPYIREAGYNTLQLMAVQEHPFYGSFGYHVSNFFAPSSRFGTPDELRALIDEAHGMGLRVIMDIVHSHAVRNEAEGISRYDGTLYQFFHDGPRGDHSAWDSRCFDYGKHQVLHFLLSNCKYWLEEFRFDGFRFDGVTSMLYLDHGLGQDFSRYDQYFNLNQDEDAMVYLYLANKLIHDYKPGAITIAEEMSGMPGLATPQSLGGLGFDFRLAMGVPDFWVRTVKEKKLEFWHVGEIYHQLSDKRQDEQTIHYAESHDQSLVGDKTLIFWLIDKDMYANMHVSHANLVVDNGIAVHKMIRLLTLCTAGNGYLNFMGNEFGHPEWVDFPGVHNHWSYHYARRQWSLRENPELKFQYMGVFDKDMLALNYRHNWLLSGPPEKIYEHVDQQLLGVKRGECLLLFNFSPFHSRSELKIPAPPGHYRVALSSDDPAYGGTGRTDDSLIYTSECRDADTEPSLMIYLPSLTSLVLVSDRSKDSQ